MRLRLLEPTFAVCRLDGSDPVPAWFELSPPLSAALRREGELALVCDERHVPPGVTAERGRRALEVAGPLDLALVGVTAELAQALAAAGVPILPLATHDTDVLLVPGDRLGDATAALRAAGHTVEA